MDIFLNLLKYLHTIKIIYQKKALELIPFQKHRKYTRFVIISQPRVGSTLLLSYLNSHPQVIIKDEIVREKNTSIYKETSIVEFLDETVYRRYHKNIKAVGFKYFYEHMVVEPDLHKYIITHKEIKVIHLKRFDLLRTYVSFKISRKIKVWSKSKFQALISLEEKKSLLIF